MRKSGHAYVPFSYTFLTMGSGDSGIFENGKEYFVRLRAAIVARYPNAEAQPIWYAAALEKIDRELSK